MPEGTRVPAEVRIGAEDFSAIRANAFKHAVAVEKAVIVDADFGAVFIDELPVEPDFEHGNEPQKIRVWGLGSGIEGKELQIFS